MTTTASSTRLGFRKLTARIGAEVTGVGPSLELDYDDLPRRLNRVTVAGGIPVSVNGQQSYSVKGDALQYTRSSRVAA
jgi:hypothetical protein